MFPLEHFSVHYDRWLDKRLLCVLSRVDNVIKTTWEALTDQTCKRLKFTVQGRVFCKDNDSAACLSLARERPQSGHIFLVIFKTVIRRSPTVHITYVMPCFHFPIVSLPESQEHEVWLLTITSYKGHNRRLREYHCDDVTRFYADITSTVGVKKSARKYPRYFLHLLQAYKALF